jgi:Holliday junction resolvase
MLKNAKAKGSQREHKTIKLLEQKGYACTRAAGSLGDWDIVAIPKKSEIWLLSDHKVRLVQVKSNKISGKERNKLKSLEYNCEVSKEIWLWKDYKRKPEIIYL